MEMQHVQFSNGQKMPILGFGTSRARDRKELERSLNDALTAGYRHFDTAYLYNNENIVGKVLHSWLTSGKVKREELFIVTKLPPIGMHEARVEHFLKKSLAALKLDYVDLYLLHSAFGLKYVDDVTHYPMHDDKVVLDTTTDLGKTWKAMEVQVRAGRSKAIGVSNFNCKEIERVVASAKILPANLQVEINVYFQQKKLRETCAKYGITVCAYAPLGSPDWKPSSYLGLLTDKVVGSIAKTHGKTAAQILLRFLIQSDIAVIPKSTNPQRIVENTAVFDFNLTPAEMAQLKELDRGEAGRSFDFFLYPEKIRASNQNIPVPENDQDLEIYYSYSRDKHN